MCKMFIFLFIGLCARSLNAMELSDGSKIEPLVHMWVQGDDQQRCPMALPLCVAEQSTVFKFLRGDKTHFFIEGILYQEVLDIMPLWSLLPKVIEGNPQIKILYKKRIVASCMQKHGEGALVDRLLDIAQRIGLYKLSHDIINERFYLLMAAFYESNKKAQKMLESFKPLFVKK